MMPKTIKPQRALNHAESQKCKCFKPCAVCSCHKTDNDPLLTKPLRDGLVGLLRKIDRLDETKITIELVDCILFVLIETSRINSEVN